MVKKKKTQEQELEESYKCDVIIYYTKNQEPDIKPNARVKIYESLPNSSLVEIDGEQFILKCSVESTIIERQYIGKSWLGWFAGALIFVAFDIYRMLHELLDVTWSVGIADALFLFVFAIPVFGWSIAISQKTYKEMSLIFNSQTGVYYSFVEASLEKSAIEKKTKLWVTLQQLQKELDENKKTKWISLEIENFIAKIEKHEQCPADLKTAWQGLDDDWNPYEIEPEEQLPEYDFEINEEKRLKSLKEIEEEMNKA